MNSHESVIHHSLTSVCDNIIFQAVESAAGTHHVLLLADTVQIILTIFHDAIVLVTIYL